jgi:hypothetical protein
MYTQNEVKIFIDKLYELCMIRPDKQDAIKTEHDLRWFLKRYWKKSYDTAFKSPLAKMPLHMNEEVHNGDNILNMEIAKWRMKIGK